jgi:hypothetical protein
MGLFKRQPEPSPSNRPLPAAAPVDPAAFEDTIYGRSDALQSAIKTVATPNDIGRPFGPGFGLETVAGWVHQVVPEPLEFRPIGQRAARAIGDGVKASVMTLDDYKAALGVNDESARRYGLRRLAISGNIKACDESARTLLAIADDDFNNLGHWFEDDAFALRMVAYFQLAMLRLIASGVPLQF